MTICGSFFTAFSVTIADGATDFIEGDQFQVSVSVGSMKYAPLSLSDATGLAVARAVAYGYTDVSSADKNGTIVARLEAAVLEADAVRRAAISVVISP